MDLLNNTDVFPFCEVVVNQFPLGKTLGEHASLATCFNHIEDGIEYVAQRVLTLAT